jgi:surface-anchored protein
MRLCGRAAIACFCLVLTATTGPSATGGMAWIDGHGDIGIGYELVDPLNPAGPRALSPHWHLGDGAGATVIGLPTVVDQEFEADEIVAVVPLTSNFTNPGGTSWNFLGAAPGATVYLLPQSNPPSTVIPFIGLSAEELTQADWSGLSWSLSLLPSSAGSFSIFQAGFPNPNVLFSSTSGPASFPVPAGHDHANFAFTAPGMYAVDWTVSGTHATDGFKSSTATFQFFVGDASAVPEPSSLGLVAVSLLLGLRRRRQR